MTTGRPKSTRDLTELERRFVAAMQQLGFGHFEDVRIERGGLALDPWPRTVRGVKFGAGGDAWTQKLIPEDFELKAQVSEFFEFVRAQDAGEIRFLEVRHGVPFRMEFEHSSVVSGEQHG